ncbi:MAG: hypothetical protein V7707_20695 [Motiliproteus sp.]
MLPSISQSTESTGLSTESVNLLQRRGLSGQQVEDFATLLDKARDQREQNISAKQVLSKLSAEEMKLLQQATSLANPIQVNTLSNEGATNLLAQPDKTGMVDLNNDGIVEVGIGKMITFPPVNAPAHVQDAWDKATENMSEGDKMTMQLHMHIATYGAQIDGISTKAPLSPEQQWSPEGWQKLLEEVRGALDFSVSMDGWTRTNLVRQDFFDKFENQLSHQTS